MFRFEVDYDRNFLAAPFCDQCFSGNIYFISQYLNIFKLLFGGKITWGPPKPPTPSSGLLASMLATTCKPLAAHNSIGETCGHQLELVVQLGGLKVGFSFWYKLLYFCHNEFDCFTKIYVVILMSKLWNKCCFCELLAPHLSK